MIDHEPIYSMKHKTTHLLTSILDRLSLTKRDLPYDIAYNRGTPRPWQVMPLFSKIPVGLLENEDFICSAINYGNYDDLDLPIESKLTIDREVFIRMMNKLTPYNASCLFKRSSIDIRDDKEIVMKLVACYGGALRYVSDRLRSDEEVVRTAVADNGYAVQYALITIDLSLAYLAVERDNGSISHLGSIYTANRSIMEFVIARCGMLLSYASEELKDDEELVLLAISKSAGAFEYASPRLRADRDFIMLAVAKNGCILHNILETEIDIEMITLAVKTYGRALQWATVEQQDDYDLVKAAVSQNGSAIKWASWRLKSDRDIVMIAVGRNHMALRYVAEKFRADKEIIMYALSQSCEAIEYIGKELKNDIEIIKYALTPIHKCSYFSALEWVGYDILDNWEMVNMAIAQSSNSTIRYASARLRNDKCLAIRAVSKRGDSIHHLSSRLQNDREVALSTILEHNTGFEYCNTIKDKNYKISYSLHDKIICLLLIGW